MNATSETAFATDVLIAGGGPAGALLGSLMARQGLDVTVVEKQATPERNFRGETISAASVRSLFQLGYGPALTEHGFLEQTGIVMREHGKRLFGIDYRRFRTPYLPIDIPQPALIDIFLADAHRAPSFRYLASTAVTDLLVDDEAVVGAVVRGKGGEPVQVRSRIVVGADGRFSRTRKRSGLDVTIAEMPRDFLWFRVPRPADWTTDGELAVSGDRNLVILPTFPDMLRIGYNLPKRGFSELRQRGLQSFLDSIVEMDERLAPLLSEHVTSFGDTSFLEIFTATMPRWTRDGLLLVGDAAHTTTPILGQGVNLALQDAIGAAHVLGRELTRTRSGVVPQAALTQFVATRQRHKKKVTAMQEMQERSLAASSPAAMRVRRVRMRALDRLPAKHTLLGRVLSPASSGYEADLMADEILAEAKRFVRLHAGHMGLSNRQISRTLDAVTMMSGTGPATWHGEFAALAGQAGRTVQQRADLLNLARFPYADSEEKRDAASQAAAIVADEVQRTLGLRLVARAPDGDIPFLFRSVGAQAPLIVVVGGIVSLKEQWAPFLRLADRFRCAVAVVDFPGVGENPLRYERSAAQLFSAIADAVDGRADSSATMLLAPSFGGHLGLLAAGADPRIRRILTIDAPLHGFFLDADAVRRMPAVTRTALAASCGVPVHELADVLPGLALGVEDLAAVEADVDFVVSSRDEVVPATDWRWAADRAPSFRFRHVKDEHGAPRHRRQVARLAATAVLRHSGRGLAGVVADAIASLAGGSGHRRSPVASLQDVFEPMAEAGV